MADSVLYEKDKKEIARYLGYGDKKLETETEDLIGIVADEVLAVADFRRVYISSPVLRRPVRSLSVFDSSFSGLDVSESSASDLSASGATASGSACEPVELEILGNRISSSALFRNLSGCDKCYLIAATLGAECDRLMGRYASVSMSKAVVLQAVCTWLLESELDEVEGELADLSENSGKFFRPRFSPGYGDLDIDLQGWILKVLDTPRKIGLSLTRGNMLIPSKSVTAFWGVSDKDREMSEVSSCIACDKEDCLMRKEG